MLSTLTAALLLTTTARADALLDGAFTSALCQAWNDSAMPGLVGRNGSGWIDSAGSEGHQVIVMGRRDCDAWPKAALVIEADDTGNAACVQGGAHDGTAFQWKFEPTTPQWADFTDGFGVMDMPGIMSGFVGPYGVAANNIGSFQVFFAVTGKLALDRKVDWDCEGGDADKIAKALGKVDLGKTAKILH